MLAGLALPFLLNFYVVRSARGRQFSDPAALPAGNVGLLLGANPYSDYARLRVEAAAQLFREGKVTHILISGDNHTRKYDEPTRLREKLIAQGVPAERITLDYAGFRTLDSLARAREVFGQRRLVIISQAFHNPRALLLARHFGIDAVAFDAPDVRYPHPVLTLREFVARNVALLDIHVLRRRPRYLGPPVAIPE